MWRINRDESGFTPADIIAWEYALPHLYLPMIDADYDRASSMKSFLLKNFSGSALKEAAAFITDKPNRILRRKILFKKFGKEADDG